MSSIETIQLQTTPEFRRQLEDDAAKMKLSLSAYIMYLHARLTPARDAGRLERHVHEVFGRHGELMHRLAK